MPIHYEKNDEHIVLITIDRPESKNSLDIYHFRDLAAAWHLNVSDVWDEMPHGYHSLQRSRNSGG